MNITKQLITPAAGPKARRPQAPRLNTLRNGKKKRKFHLVAVRLPALLAALWLGLTGNVGATDFTVTNPNDDSGPGTGTLRDILLNVAHDNDTIKFDASITYIKLSTELPIIQHNLTIVGNGPKATTIDGTRISRIFHIFSTASANISGLTISNGAHISYGANLDGIGGGILNEGELSMSQCNIANCLAEALTPQNSYGGGIYNSDSGFLAMNACTITGCSAVGGEFAEGGGLYSGLSVTMTACTVSGCSVVSDTATTFAQGGGLLIHAGYGALTNCTLSGNSVFPGDSAELAEGGAICSFGTLAMVNCTVSDNVVHRFGVLRGGGIATEGAGSALSLINCIVLGNSVAANNVDPSSVESDIYVDPGAAFTSGGNNLHYRGDPTASGGIDSVYGSVAPLRLGVLRNNGGPTPTMSIGKAGVAFDAGNDGVLFAPYNLTIDQRGITRPQGLHVDVGAYEAFVFPGCSLCLECCQPVYWISQGDGAFGFSSNWTGGSPGTNSSVSITNSGSKTVTIDTFTSPSALAISDLLLSAPSNSVNTLLVSAGPALPFSVQGNFFMLGGSALVVSNSTIQMDPASPPTNDFANGSSVIFDGPATFFNNASLDTANAFDLTVGNSAPGTLSMTNSSLKAYDLFVGSGANGAANFDHTDAVLNRSLFIATAPLQVGIVNIVGGSFIATNNLSTNSPSLLMERGNAQMTISGNASVQFGSGLLGASGGTTTFTEQVAGGQVSFAGPLQLENGTLSLQEGATLSLGSSLIVAAGSNSTAQVNITGGTSAGGVLTCTNAPILIGPGGSAQMTISAGTVTAQLVNLGGQTPSASGLLHLTGNGLLTVLGDNQDGDGLSMNDCQQDGGALDVSQASIVIGQNHNAQYNLSGGTAIASNLYVGFSPGFVGTFTQSGGTLTVLNKLIVGDCVSNAIGTPTISGGTLYVTNPTHTAVLDARNGTFTMNGGTLIVDTLVVTNSCGHFIKNGGTLVYRQLILDPNMDADGDGLPNGLEESLGLDPLNPSHICAPQGLVDWWPAGGTASDTIGTNDGVLQNGATFAPGVVGQAFDFNGVDQYVQVPGYLNNAPTTEVTVEFWQKVASVKVQSTFSASAFVNGSVFNAHVPYADGNVYWDFGDISNGGRLTWTPPTSITGSWWHFALLASQSGNFMALYTNGVLAQFKTGMTPFVPANLDLDIGGAASLGLSFGGQIDEFSIFNRALTAPEIQAIYAAGSSGKCVPPVYITSATYQRHRGFSLTWLAQQGLLYLVQSTPDLSSSSWNVVGEVLATGGSASITDLVPPSEPQQFYRVEMFR